MQWHAQIRPYAVRVDSLTNTWTVDSPVKDLRDQPKCLGPKIFVIKKTCIISSSATELTYLH